MTVFIHPDYTEVARAQLGNGTLVLGSPGSGKTSIILPYIKKLKAAGEKTITLDVKNEQPQKLGNDVHILAPWVHGSLVLDIAKDITTKAGAQLLADALLRVPDSGKDKVWAAAANSVGASLILDLIKNKPQAWTWTDLADQLDKSVEEWAALMQAHTPSSAKILEGAAETSASVAFNVVTELRSLRAVADMFSEAERFGGKRFSVRQWLHDKNYPIRQVVLCSSAEYASAVGFIVPLIVNYIATQIERMPEGTSDPKNIILDEFAQLPIIASIAKIYELGRSKGLNMLLAVQDWAQVEQKYGEHGAAIIFSNASIKVIARTSVSHSRDKIAQLLGSREVSVLSQSHSSGSGAGAPSVSQTYQEKTIPLVMPGELESELGPHSFVPNPIPGKDPIPTKIRAILRPMSGDIFYLDWPVVHFPQLRGEPRLLPSHHEDAELVRHIMRDTATPLGKRVQTAYKRANITVRDLAALLYSDSILTPRQWKEAQKNATQLLNSLPTIHDEEEPGDAAAPAEETPATLAQVREVEPAHDAPAHPMMAPTTRSGRQSIDELITDHRDERGVKVFEGLKPEDQPRPATEADALTDVATLATLEKLGGSARAVEVGKIVVETLEALEEKQAPEAIQTEIGDEEERRRQHVAKFLAGLKRKPQQ